MPQEYQKREDLFTTHYLFYRSQSSYELIRISQETTTEMCITRQHNITSLKWSPHGPEVVMTSFDRYETGILGTGDSRD